MTEQWLSIVEYAKKHDISDMTVRRRIRAGKITAELREGKYFIKCSSSQPGASHSVSPSAPSSSGDTMRPRPGAAAGNPQPNLHNSSQHSYQGHSPKNPKPSPRGAAGQPDLPPIPVPYPGDRRKGPRRAADMNPRGGVTTDRRTSHYEEDFSYPQLDLAGTRRPSAGVLNEGQSIGVQLTQLEAKIDHLAQPWQQELMASMKTQLDLKDEKISQLQQKIEDLEMIVQMLSSRDSSDATPSISLGGADGGQGASKATNSTSGFVIPPPPSITR